MGGKLLSSLTLARSHTGAAAVLVDEFDTGQLQDALDDSVRPCRKFELHGTD
jgi:hypothetical protein